MLNFLVQDLNSPNNLNRSGALATAAREERESERPLPPLTPDPSPGGRGEKDLEERRETEAPGEAQCPPPLAWQEVLREFHQTADAWYLDRAGYRISGRTIGSGPPLYFLNGFSGTHELYALLAWLLRDGYRCVLFDYAPTSRRAPLSLDRLIDDLVAVAETCGDRTCDLFASSLGGLVAFGAMRREPGRFRRAIVQGGFARRELSLAERLLIGLCRLHPGKVRHLPLRRFLQQQNHRPWFPPFDATRWEFLAQNTGNVRLSQLAGLAALVRDTDLRPALRDIVQPVLLVGTEGEGRILEQYGRELAKGLSGSKQEHLNATGQFPFLTHPHRLAKIIREFLAGVPASSGKPLESRL